MNKANPNLSNVTRGIEMIKYEVHQQDVRIKELENLLVFKNQQIVGLESQVGDWERKYNTVLGSFNRLISDK
jgi:hypothetical protein